MRFTEQLAIAGLIVGALLSDSSLAQSAEDFREMEAITRQTAAFLERVEKQEPPDWLMLEPDEATKARARRIADEAMAPMKGKLLKPVQRWTDGTVVHVFLSFSMPEVELRMALEEVAYQENTVAVLRGMAPEDLSLMDTLGRLRNLTDSLTMAPTVEIDPTRFTRWSVSVVPTLVATHNGESIGEVRGSMAIERLRERVETSDRYVDMGREGPVWEIAERDIIEEMESRVTSIDWAEKKRQAKARFWRNYEFHSLPAATTNSERVVDPTVFVTKDVRTDEGALIAAAGTRINPLDRMPMRMAIIAFDATSEKQIEIARLLKARANESGRRAVLVMSQIHRDTGWDEIPRLQRLFGQSVFLLQPGFAQRFGIKEVPSVVTSKGAQFLVNTYRVPSGSVGDVGVNPSAQILEGADVY